MKQIYDFLSRLRANNNREWFAIHKNEYLEVKKKSESLCAALLDRLSTIDSDAKRLRVADCTYRIYRDTRFSADKLPYKTHIGIFLNPPEGKKSPRCGYYLHLEPGEGLFAAGTICLPGPIVRAIRQLIFAEIDEYRSIVEDSEFKKLLPQLGDNYLKTYPKGFPKDWPYMDYIKPRDFLAFTSLTDEYLTSFNLSTETGVTDLADQLIPFLLQANRFNNFINYAIDSCTEESDHEADLPIIY